MMYLLVMTSFDNALIRKLIACLLNNTNKQLQETFIENYDSVIVLPDSKTK